MSPRDVVVLGSTGSIGTQALDLVRANPDRFRVVGADRRRLATRTCSSAQVAEFAPAFHGLGEEAAIEAAARAVPTWCSTASPAPSGCARRWPRSTPATPSRWPTRSR